MSDSDENEVKKRRRTSGRSSVEAKAKVDALADVPDEGDEDGEANEEETVTPVINPEDELDEIYNRSSDQDEEGEVQTGDVPAARPPTGRTRARGVINSARDLILEEVQERVLQANERLRANLLGSLLIEVSDKNEKYLFDWKEPTARILRVEGQPAPAVDCSVKISERDLLRIASGDLNPQVAMLSDKVQGKGKLGMAVYFFNLIVQSNE